MVADTSGRWIPGTADSNPAKAVDVRLLYLLCCVGSGLCDELDLGSKSTEKERKKYEKYGSFAKEVFL